MKKIIIGIQFGIAGLLLALNAPAAPLTAGDPILLPGTTGGFDFIRIDTNQDRLLLGHEANKTMDVFDLATKKLLKAVPTGTAQDAAVDVKRDRYYVSGNDPGRMVIVNASNLTVTAEVAMPTNTDLIAFDPVTSRIYECNDTAGQVWVIDADGKNIMTTIQYDGRGVEDLALDPDYQHLYQAVKGANTIAVVDAANNNVLTNYPLAPDKGPHGIAIVPDNDGLLVACAGKLVMLDRSTGKIISTADTGARVDEMAYDPGLHQAYCASRGGNISVVGVAADKLTALGNVPDTATGSITVDPKTHIVWIAYVKSGQSFMQPFTPTAN